LACLIRRKHAFRTPPIPTSCPPVLKTPSSKRLAFDDVLEFHLRRETLAPLVALMDQNK